MASWIINLASQTMSFIATICIYVIYIVIVYTVLCSLKLCSLIKDLILFIMNILQGIMKHIPLCYCYGVNNEIS